ncbi:MAG: sodium:proton antiporter, partial [Polaromonas sp.]|nr:sodium:proton antiporter [Polaromonas sp.]
ALRRIDNRGGANTAAAAPASPAPEPEPADLAALQTSQTEAPATLMRAVERFNAQLESFVEVAIVMAVGALIAVVPFRWEVLWFTPLLFFVIRPAAVYAGIFGTGVQGQQRRLMAWFGIRGIGSIYYLAYAIRHDIDRDLAERLLSLTIAVVVASVVAHGVSVTPLMNRYESRKARRGKQPSA